MHILIVTHYYPPLNAIASFRPAGFAKYFAEQGVNITVLTTVKTEADGSLDLERFGHARLKIVEVPYAQLQFWRKQPAKKANTPALGVSIVNTGKPSLLKELFTRLRKWGVSYLGSLVDYQFFWTREAVRAFEQIHEKAPVDIIISTFSPPAAHFVASRITKKYPGVKWIADYRDLWSQRHIMTAKGMFNVIEQAIEKRTIRRAGHITTVSQPLADKLRVLVKEQIPVSVIYNGYDSAPFPPVVRNRRQFGAQIRIVYTGTIYKGRSDPSPLFQALNELESDGVVKEGDILLEFYGDRMANLPELVLNYNASKWVRLNGHISHEKALAVQRDADFLLFLESNSPDARGVLTGKLFEYMITGNTILAVGVDEYCASAQVIMETQTGAVFGPDKTKIKNYLRKVWVEKAEPERYPDEKAIAGYSRQEQAKHMLQIVKEML